MRQIRVQETNGTWETLGQDRFPGAWPQEINPSYNTSGPDALSFTVLRPPRIVHRDLQPFTPVELLTDSSTVPVWSGYTIQAPPGAAGQTQVACLGWQHYLDEVQFPMNWVHARLAEFIDVAGILESNPASINYSGNVSADQRGLVMTYSVDGTNAVPGNAYMAAVLDLGSGNWATNAVIEFDSVLSGGLLTILRAHNVPSWLQASTSSRGSTDIMTRADTAAVGAGPAVALGHVSTPKYRFWTFAFGCATSILVATPWQWRIRRALIGQNVYLKQTPGLAQVDNTWSLLNLSDVCRDLVEIIAGDAIKHDFSQITDTTFNIPHFSFKEPTTVRAMLDKGNSYHGYRVGVDAQQRLFLKPQPSIPALTVNVGDLGQDAFVDQSTNDGTELYNHVRVSGASGSGAPLIADYNAADFTSTYRPTSTWGPYGASAAGTIANNSFTVDTSGWTAHTAGTIVRDTTVFNSTPASLKSTPSSTIGSGPEYLFPTKDFRAGVAYKLTLWIRANAGTKALTVIFGNTTTTDNQAQSIIVGTTFTQYDVIWEAQSNWSGTGAIGIQVGNTTGETSAFFIDDLSLTEAHLNLPETVTLSSNQPVNPSFTVDTSGWVSDANAQVLTRDTGLFDTSPASLSIQKVNVGTGVGAFGTVNGSFVKGRNYRLTIMATAVAGTPLSCSISSPNPLSTGGSSGVVPIATTNVFQPIVCEWSPNITVNDVRVLSSHEASGLLTWHVDSVKIEEVLYDGVVHMNPTANDNATSWWYSDGNSALRDQGFFNSAPASFSFSSFGGTSITGYTNGFRGDFKAGVPYRLGMDVGLQINSVANSGWTVTWRIDFGNFDGVDESTTADYSSHTEEFTFSNPTNAAGIATTNWATNTVNSRVTWVPLNDYSARTVNARIVFSLTDVIVPAWNRACVDSLTLEIGQPATLMDRRRRRKSFNLQVGSPTDPLTMRGLAQAWLLAHRTTPFKGTLNVTSDNIDIFDSGTTVPRQNLGQYVGEIIRLADVLDPDTATQGRDAIITGVSGLDTVQITMDNTPKGLDALLARMAAAQGAE